MVRASTAGLAGRLSSRRRLVLAAAAIFCLFGYAFNLAHMVLVQHTTCVAHDEVVHGGSATPDPLPETVSVRPAVPRDDHNLDHCLALSLTPRASEVAREPRPLVLPPPAPPRAQPAEDALVVPAPVPLLALAPKSSPPANG